MRLRGLELGRVGMEKLKNSHKGGVVRKFRTRHYSPAQMQNCGAFKWEKFLVFEGGKCWLRQERSFSWRLSLELELFKKRI